MYHLWHDHGSEEAGRARRRLGNAARCVSGFAISGHLDSPELSAGSLQPAPPPVNPTPVTEDEVLHLARRLSTPASCGSADLSSQLSSLALNSTTTSDDPESLLLAYIRTAFSNLESIEKSFRPASTPLPPATSPLPTFKTITIFYDLVKARPKALNTLREHVEAILRRPGPSLLEGDGGWVVVLFEVRLSFSVVLCRSSRR
jgi:hypothetical protein